TYSCVETHRVTHTLIARASYQPELPLFPTRRSSELSRSRLSWVSSMPGLRLRDSSSSRSWAPLARSQLRRRRARPAPAAATPPSRTIASQGTLAGLTGLPVWARTRAVGVGLTAAAAFVL